MSFASKVTYTGDGATDSFNVPMPYISTSHIQVFVNEIFMLPTMDYNFSGATTIVFTSPPGVDDAIVIRRWTSPTDTLVDFVDGSTLRANDLDTAYLHNFYLSQEYADTFTEVINNAILNIASGVGIVETEPDAVIAALVNQMLSEDAAANLQQRITDIDNNAEAIITLGEGLQVQINTLAEGVAAQVFVQADEPVPGVGGIPDPISEGARWYDTDDNNAPYIYQSSAWVSITDPRIGVADAAITALQVQTDYTNAALIDEMFVRATETTALSTRLAVLGAATGDGSAFILDLDKVYVDETESIGSRFTQITSDFNTNSAAITAEQVTRASETGALAADIALMGVKNGAETAFILDTSTVKIDSDGGDTFATRLTALSVADSDNSASITTIQDVTIPGINSNIDAIEAEYGVDLDVNGYVTGFRILNGGTPGASAFVIRADKFAVVDTTGGTLTEYVPFEIVGGKINMRGDVQIDGDLLVSGSINGQTALSATYPLGSTLIGPNAIYSTHIGAGEVKTVNLEALAVTADKINVDNLEAVKASTGSLTVDGALTIGTAGHVKGGQTAYNTGTGYWLGYSSGYKFSIGNPSTGNYMKWDGTTLTVKGDMFVGNYAASDTLMLSADTGRTSTSTSFTEKKAFTIDRAGTVRVKVDAKYQGPGSPSGGEQYRILVDGVVKATQTAGSSFYQTYTHDISGLVADSSLTIENKTAGLFCVIANCRVYGTVVIPADGGTVDLD